MSDDGLKNVSVIRDWYPPPPLPPCEETFNQGSTL